LCISTIALANRIAHLIGEPKLTPLLRWASIGLLITSLSTIQGRLFTKGMDFRRPALRIFVANLSGVIVGVGMALAGYGVWALIGQQLAAAIAGTTFFWISSDYRPSLTFS